MILADKPPATQPPVRPGTTDAAPGTTLWMRHTHAARWGRVQDPLGRCPVCDDELCLGHRHPGPAAHVLSCANPDCSYERDYDAALHGLLEALSTTLARVEALEHLHTTLARVEARLIRMESHEAWLLVQVVALCARVNDQEVRACS